ncbi:hypothetical protein RB653_006560 [Dictyostelium firmibasis]|uniref:Uncharacterized protein n=1 Tax=Dictyostelium firmibasis TaxID=79012 RepID=A0AAN7TT98_9MYCE
MIEKPTIGPAITTGKNHLGLELALSSHEDLNFESTNTPKSGSISQCSTQCGRFKPTYIESLSWPTIELDIVVTLPSEIALLMKRA